MDLLIDRLKVVIIVPCVPFKLWAIAPLHGPAPALRKLLRVLFFLYSAQFLTQALQV